MATVTSEQIVLANYFILWKIKTFPLATIKTTEYIPWNNQILTTSKAHFMSHFFPISS